jgi:flagellar FliJ protein
MANFHFRLAAVLKVREAERQQRRLELAQAFEADRVLQQQIDALASELALARQQSRQNAAPGQINVDRLLEFQRYALHVMGQSKTVRLQQSSIRDEIERRRKAVVEADRQVRTLENLREKQLAAHRVEEFKTEQKSLDEAGARRIQKFS